MRILVVVYPMRMIENATERNQISALYTFWRKVEFLSVQYNMNSLVVTYMQNKLSLDSSNIDKKTKMKQNTIVMF